MTDDDAIERLLELTNPTGALRSATPWAASGETEITAAGATIAQFRHGADRNVALYFTNNHAGMIALLRSHAQAFDAISLMTADANLQAFARRQARNARIYADLFCRLGKPEERAPGLEDRP
jgi:hypothetical protein